jgi:ligand-binding sensor domain-containing protein
VFGEHQYKGIQIFDIIQDDKIKYWVAKIEGLYYYDYYQFRKVECVDTESNSVFNYPWDEKEQVIVII